MIICINGCSGSGKTYLARRVMKVAGITEPVRALAGGREREIGRRSAKIFFAGSYDETVTAAGCDTLKWDVKPGGQKPADWLEELLAREAVHRHVVAEGLTVSNWSPDRWRRLKKMVPVTVVALTTSLKDCAAAVDHRRRVKAERQGKTAETFNPALIADRRDYLIRSVRPRLRAAGIPVEELDREAAYFRVCELLRVKP